MTNKKRTWFTKIVHSKKNRKGMKNASNSVAQKLNGLHAKKTSLGSSMAFADDSDEHDFFNPI